MAKFEDIFLLKDKVSDSIRIMYKNLRSWDKSLEESQTRLKIFQKNLEHINKYGKGLQDFGNKMTVGVTLPIVGLGAAMVKSAADMESMQQQLSTMLGSELEGAKMFDEIKTMAAKTPFGTKDLMSATNTMLGFGIAQEKVLPLMSQLGDISGGNAQRFQSLALAFSQVSSAGKLQGQDFLQMITAGFNPLEAIAKRTGKSVGYWKKEMSKGRVTVEMVEQAMKDATSEGGRFYKMMDKQSLTALGQWSTFMDNLSNVLAEFGKIILPVAINGLQKLSSALEWLNSLPPGTKKFILILGGFAAVIGPLITGFGSLVVSIGALSTALMTLLANPVVLTIIAWTAVIAGIVAGIWALVKAIQALVKHFQHLKRMKIPSLRTDNLTTDNYQKLAGLQASMGDKAFTAKYGQEVSRAVTSYRQSSIRNTTNNTTTNNNFYGNIQGYNQVMPLSNLTAAGMNFAGVR